MIDKRNLLVVSTSTVHGKPYLSYIMPAVKNHFKDCSEIIFVPYARPSGITWNEYTQKAAEAFERAGMRLKGMHEFPDPVHAMENASGVFIGGGNTFLLLHDLYHFNLMEPLRKRILNGMPYMGTSAGSNITGLTIGTTNDMPIVLPPTFEALQVLPFNLNPHYLDPDPDSKHMGETRETRINEFHHFNTQPVLGLREGSWLEMKDGVLMLMGTQSARLFKQGALPQELPAGADCSFLVTASQ